MDLSQLTQPQKQAVTFENGPLLIVAGAGTGKTMVLTKRIAWLILEKKIPADQILALTFTDKAAQEMEGRVDELLPYGYVDLWVSTFHSFCDRVLRQHGLDIGLSTNYKLLTQTEQWLLVRQNLEKFKLDYYKPLGNPTKFIHSLLNHFSRCKDEVIYPQDYLKHAEDLKLNNDSPDFVKKIDLADIKEKDQKEILKQEILRINEVAEAYHTYQNLLLENNYLDFGDLINYVLKLFQERPNILAQYRQQFKYILVDEFQDTNYAQYELVKLLAAPKNNLTVVGDDNQAIYKFRGASVSNIMQFKEDYPNSENIVLNDNFRSCQEILDKSYDFIKLNDPETLEYKLGINKKLTAHLKEDCFIEHLNCSTAEEEADTVISKISQLRNQNDELRWSDFAILVRANNSAELFNQTLASKKIPYNFVALKGLYTKPVILDIIAYFKLLDNYHESSAVFRVLNAPFVDLAVEDLIKINYFARRKGISVFETLKIVETIKGLKIDTVDKVKNLLSLIERQTSLAKNRPSTEVLLKFMYDSGYVEYLKGLPEQISLEQLNYVQQFFEKIKKFESSYSYHKVKDFLQLMDLEIEAGETGSLKTDLDSDLDAVQVMTIHASKGLEFKYVFIVNLVNRKFPTIERKEPIQIPDNLVKEILPEGDVHLQEERRLFYVGMTRAKQGLFFTSAENYGGKQKKKLSRFLGEMGYHQESMLAPCSGRGAIKGFTLAPFSGCRAQENKKYPIPKKFSYSQLATFAKCPLQYKYSYIYKIPTFGKHVFSFGTTIHNTLQKLLEQSFEINNSLQSDLFGSLNKENQEGKKLLPLTELYKLYEESWVDEWYDDQDIKQAYKKKGKEILEKFYYRFEREKPEVKFLERAFNLKINQYSLNGRIDRIDQVKDGVEIIDYKTGQSKADKPSSEEKKQLLIYQIAAEEVFNLKPAKLTYYFLEDEKIVSFIGQEKDKIKLKEWLLENIEKIVNSDFQPTPGFACQYCDYKGICEFRK